MAITWVGASSSEIQDRKNCVSEAWEVAKGKYVMDAIVRHTSQDLFGLLAGAIAIVIASALVIVMGNVGGAAVGGAIGALAGGAGAAPGAALGRVIGNWIAKALLEILGVAMLLQFIVSELSGIGMHFYTAVDCAWNTAGLGVRLYGKRIDFAARHFAEGIGKFFGALVMGLVIIFVRNKLRSGSNGDDSASGEKTNLLNSKLMALCDGLEAYLVKNLSTLEAKYKNGLIKATVTEGLPETPEDMVKAEKEAVLEAEPFADMPNFFNRKVSELQDWLTHHDFEKVAEVRRPGETKPDGTKYEDFQSEIWIRRKTTLIECVRIDPEGHIKVNGKPQGVVRITVDTSGPFTSRRLAWGETPHFHMDTIEPGMLPRYLTSYVPEAVTYEMDGRPIRELEAFHKSAQEWATRVFGSDGQLAAPLSKFRLGHIRLKGG